MTAEASIPVNLFNPGQVFGCLGFLEAADVLLGPAEGRFDWSNEADISFRLRARCDENPFGVVLGFLARSTIHPCTPPRCGAATHNDDNTPVNDGPHPSETFPGPAADNMALPIRIVGGMCGPTSCIDVGHWADASSRDDFKLYSGNRSAATIACAMLFGTREKPKKGQCKGEVKTRGLSALWTERRSELVADPFGVLTRMGGSFNFDPRGAWTGIDAGYSPNEQKHGLVASPVVEIFAAIGLEHARPHEYEKRQVRYAVWGCFLPPMLARPVLAGAGLSFPKRVFSFELALSGKNKVVTFAEEEMQS